jgi:hypothetical protein
MKTNDLIGALATGAGPAPRAVALLRLAPVALGGLLAAALGALGLLGGVPADMWFGPALWTKLAYAGALVLAAGWLAARLGRPAADARTAQRAVLAVVGLMALAGVAAYAATPPAGRGVALFGHSWLRCPWAVLGLSLPALAGAFWALRGLAPTRPRAAGLACGLFAGALGAAGYALACTEQSPTFIALWYSAGIAMSAAIGAGLGPRLLRW